MLLKKENLKNAPLLSPPPPPPNVTGQLDKSGNSWRVVLKQSTFSTYKFFLDYR